DHGATQDPLALETGFFQHARRTRVVREYRRLQALEAVLGEKIPAPASHDTAHDAAAPVAAGQPVADFAADPELGGAGSHVDAADGHAIDFNGKHDRRR